MKSTNTKNTVCDPAHGRNKDGAGAAKKQGGNKGIAAAKKRQKREDAEFRASLVDYRDTKKYRLAAELQEKYPFLRSS